MVDLCDADGTILREAAGNYANIFDDNFTGFAFGTAYTAAQAETLCLHIYNVGGSHRASAPPPAGRPAKARPRVRR